MEIYRGRTPMFKGRLLRNGRPATAKVRFCRQSSDDEGNPSWARIQADLDITMPGGEVQTLRGLYNGHRKAARFVWPGTVLPVKLHPDEDDKLAIDWKAWESGGGLADAKARGDEHQVFDANEAIER